MSSKKLESDNDIKEALLNFVVDELAKSGDKPDEKTLEFLSNSIADSEKSNQEIKLKLQKKLETTIPTDVTQYSGMYGGLQQSLNKIDKTKDLGNIQDPTTNFSPLHVRLLKRIFGMQTTQNYFSGLKWLITDDLVCRQTSFNSAMQEAVGNLVNLLNETRRNSDAKQTEMEAKYQAKLMELKNKINLMETSYQEKLNENTKELDFLKQNLYKPAGLVISLIYEQFLKRKPLLWEQDCWISFYKSKVIGYDELIDKIKSPIESTKIQKEFLRKKGISFGENDIAFKTVDGFKIYFDGTDRILIESYYPKHYEKSTVNTMKKFIKNGMNVLNIGANVGFLSIFAAKIVGKSGKVISFEPHPKNIEFIKRNVSENNFDNIIIEQMAVSGKTGKTTILNSTSSLWHSLGTKEGPGFKRIDIETTTIDDYLGDKKVDFIIMDAEGSEKFILEGMKKTFEKNPTLQIITEFNPMTLEFNESNGKEFLDTIDSFGFSKFVIDEQDDKLKPFTTKEILRQFPSGQFVNLYLKREKIPKR